MKYILKKTTFLIIVIFITSLNAQIAVPLLAYKEALHIINPAHAGASKKIEAMALMKTQTMDVPKAPQTQYFSVTAPLGRNMSSGISIINDEYHITRETQIYADIAYKLKIDETKNIFFGLKTGWTSLNINLHSLGKEEDNSLNTPVKTPFNVNFGTGLYLQTQNYYVGFSVPKILRIKRYSSLDENSKLTGKIQLYLNSGYVIDFSKEDMQISLTPSLMLRNDESANSIVELGLLFKMMNKFEIGVSHRFKESFGVLAMFKFMDLYKFGYGFESFTSSINGSSHQFALRATF